MNEPFSDNQWDKALQTMRECIPIFQKLLDTEKGNASVMALSLAMLMSTISTSIKGGKKAGKAYLDEVLKLTLDVFKCSIDNSTDSSNESS